MDAKPVGRVAAVGCRQQRQYRAEGIFRQAVGDGACPGGDEGLRRVGKGIETRIRNELGGQGYEQVAVQNGRLGPQLGVDEGVLDPFVGQNGEVRHLTAGAGGGGDGNEGCLAAGKIDHGLGAVHGAAAAQGHQHVRGEGLQGSGAFRRKGDGGVGLDVGIVLDGFRLGCRADGRGSAVFVEIGVCDDHQPPGMKVGQCLDSAGAGDDLGRCLKSIHCFTAFSMGSMPGFEKIM